jgi:hypothetical protein
MAGQRVAIRMARAAVFVFIVGTVAACQPTTSDDFLYETPQERGPYAPTLG